MTQYADALASGPPIRADGTARSATRRSISVIIPAHRDRGYLGETLATVRPQLAGSDEILIAANGCDAAYLRKLESLSDDVVRILHVPEKGIAVAQVAYLCAKAHRAAVLFTRGLKRCPPV